MENKKTISSGLLKAGDYVGLVSSVGELLEQARRTSARTVNAILTATYWEIGRRIVEFEQEGKRKAGYGEGLLEQLSIDLRAKFGKGFGQEDLRNMRLFFIFYPETAISQTVFGKLEEEEKSWTASGISDPTTNPQTLFAKSAIVKTPSEISRTLSGKFTLSDLAQAFPLPWSHYVRLLSVDNFEARAFYEAEAIRGGWSVRLTGRAVGADYL